LQLLLPFSSNLPCTLSRKLAAIIYIDLTKHALHTNAMQSAWNVAFSSAELFLSILLLEILKDGPMYDPMAYCGHHVDKRSNQRANCALSGGRT
jgi:hypothetical protein